jgi:ketosteroid isomerase-like protein
MRFRKLIIPIAASLCVFGTIGPARSQSGDQLYTATRQQLDVTKALLAAQAAWNTGDLDGFLAHYKDAPDTQAVLAAPAFGIANIRAAFRVNFPNRDAMGALEWSEIQVRSLGDNFALASGRFHLHRSKKGGGDVEGTFADVLEKTPAGWQIIFSEST